MNVRSLPRASSRDLYTEAIDQYTERVRSRANAVYQVGNVTYPGLSDIDLLVVPKRPAHDNQYFFSAFHRAPRASLRLFLHEPFILPPTTLEAAAHTTHGKRKLLYGEDVLSGYEPSRDSNEARCRLLESYCSYEQFLTRAQSSQSLDGRWTIAVASALRFLVADVATLGFEVSYEQYATAIDAIRADAFERGIRDAVLAAWTLFERTFTDVSRFLHRYVPSAQAASEVLRGLRSWDAISVPYARARYAVISRYHDELERFGFPYGHLFFVAPYDRAVRAVQPGAYARYISRNAYRLQRRVSEYARG